MARFLVAIAALIAAKVLFAANTEPAPSQAAKPLVATVPDWKALDDDPMPSGAILRIGSSRARHGIVTNIVSSKDGRLFYAGMNDRTICIWEAESGKLVRSFKPVSHPITSIAVAPDGNIIAAAAGASIHLWNVNKRTDTPRTLQGHENSIAQISFSNDGQLLLSGSHDRKARLWDVAGGRSIREVSADADNAIYSVAFARDDSTFFTCSYGGRVLQWKTQNGEKLREWKGPKEIAQIFALPDGKTLAAITYYNGAYLWDLNRKDSDWHVKHLPGRHGYGAFSPDGRLLVTAAHSFPADAPIKICDLKQEKDVIELPGHRSGTYFFVFSTDSKTLTTYGNDHTLRRWDLTTRKEIGIVAGHQNRVTGAHFTSDGKHIVTCSQDGTVRFSDSISGKELVRLSAENEHFDALALSPDGRTLTIAGSPMPTRWRWELEPDKRIFNLRTWNFSEKKEENRWHIPGHAAYELHFTPDGREVLSVGYGKVVFHDIKTGKSRQPIPNAQQNLRAASISPDGKRVAISTDEPALRQIAKVAYYDAANGKETFSKTLFLVGVNGLAFSPNGKHLAVTNGGDRNHHGLALWDPVNGNVQRSFVDHRYDYGVQLVVWSPDGRLIAATDSFGVSIYEVATGQERMRFRGGHVEQIRSAAFSPDSRKLVTAGDDTLVMVWDVTGVTIANVQALESRELDAAWAGLAELDGEIGGKNIARLAARPAESVPYLRQRLGVLSADERKRIDELVAQLDSDQFRVRDKAAKELAIIGEPTIPALTRVLERSKSVEMRNQAERLLEKIGPGEDAATSAVARRMMRSVEVLERAGTPEAVFLLRELASLGKSRLLHNEAAQALRRLK
jgi:WD40 repeat protein